MHSRIQGLFCSLRFPFLHATLLVVFLSTIVTGCFRIGFEPYISPCDGITCDGYGVCESVDGEPQCICNEGYQNVGTIHCRESISCETDADCDDGEECTSDRCDVNEGLCDWVASNEACDDHQFCTLTDLCTSGVCVGFGDACPGQSCSEEDNRCFDIRDGDSDDADIDVASECIANYCNESNGGGTCEESSGVAICSCNTGFAGPRCDRCGSGYHPDSSGGCVLDDILTCEPSSDGESVEVQAPILRMTLPASWDENWFASPAVADIDFDGDMEIIAARHSVLYVWDHMGALVWRAAWPNNSTDPEDHGSARMYSSPVVGDFDGDGDMEIAVGAGVDGVNIAVYDHNGILLEGWPLLFGESEVRAITAADLDGDGLFEIIVNKTDTGPATAIYSLSGVMQAGWPQVNSETCDPPEPASPCWDFGGYNQNIGLADLDNDDSLDIISTYAGIGFGIFHRDGSPFPTYSEFDKDEVVTSVAAYHDLTLALQGWGSGDRSSFSSSPPAMADIIAGGDLELVVVGNHVHSSSNDSQGVTFWLLNHDMSRPPGWEWPIDTGMPLHVDGTLGKNMVPSAPSPSIGELTENEGLEILAPAYDGYLYAFSSDGIELWRFEFGQSLPYIGASEALIADLNIDGVPEVIFSTFSSGEPREPETAAHLVILSNNGVELQRVEFPIAAPWQRLPWLILTVTTIPSSSSLSRIHLAGAMVASRFGTSREHRITVSSGVQVGVGFCVRGDRCCENRNNSIGRSSSFADSVLSAVVPIPSSTLLCSRSHL